MYFWQETKKSLNCGGSVQSSTVYQSIPTNSFKEIEYILHESGE